MAANMLLTPGSRLVLREPFHIQRRHGPADVPREGSQHHDLGDMPPEWRWLQEGLQAEAASSTHGSSGQSVSADHPVFTEEEAADHGLQELTWAHLAGNRASGG